MTLTVRLDAALEAALERHCAERGVTKSLVVQECLASYLVADRDARNADAARPPTVPGPAFRAFADAGLIGAVAGGNVPADKANVRQQVQRRLSRSPRAG